MKVLITTDWYAPVVNGVVTSVLELARGLEELGCEVRILTLAESLQSRREGNVTYIGSVGVGLVYPNARLRLAQSHRLVRELIAWRPDVVHSQCEFSTFFLARRIARACHAPLVHTYHTVYEDFTHYFSPSVRLGKAMAASFSRRVLANVQAVIAPTEKVTDMLRGYGVTQPVFTVPTGLSMERFSAPEPAERARLRASLGFGPGDFVLVYVGRLAKEKNIGELLALLETEAPADARLLLVGDGPARAELESETAARGLTGRVRFTGMVEPSRVAAYYGAGDVFVSASQSETQGLTYFEAMACALPPLCKNDPCLDGVIADGQNGFVYDSPAEFAAAARTLRGDPDTRTALGERARRTVCEHFSAAGFAQAVSEVYRACLSSAEEVPVQQRTAAHKSGRRRGFSPAGRKAAV